MDRGREGARISDQVESNNERCLCPSSTRSTRLSNHAGACRCEVRIAASLSVSAYSREEMTGCIENLRRINKLSSHSVPNRQPVSGIRRGCDQCKPLLPQTKAICAILNDIFTDSCIPVMQAKPIADDTVEREFVMMK